MPAIIYSVKKENRQAYKRIGIANRKQNFQDMKYPSCNMFADCDTMSSAVTCM